jgi:drug/metabolite transporter (DMT)-like permease
VSRATLERGYASALAAVVIWALVPVGTRFFVLRVDPYVFNGIRFLASCGAGLPLFLHARPWRWPRADKLLLAACAVLAVPGYNIPVALGARSVPAGELGLLIATEPVMIAALALLFQRRPVHRRVVAGSLIAFLGVALTSGVLSGARNFQWVSTLQVLSGAFSWSCYTVLAGPLNKRYGTFAATGAIIVVGYMALFALSWPMFDAHLWPDRANIMVIGAMGLSSSLLGFLLWNYAGALVPSERLGLYLYLIPVVSVFVGTQFLNEALSAQILLGGALIVMGVWIASRASQPVAVAAAE